MMLSLSYYAIDIDTMAIKTLFQFLKQEQKSKSGPDHLIIFLEFAVAEMCIFSFLKDQKLELKSFEI